MSEEIVVDGRRSVEDLLRLAAGGATVKVEEVYHIYSGVEVEVDPPDEEENGDDPKYFKLDILVPDDKHFHRVYTHPDLDKPLEVEDYAVMATQGMIVFAMGWAGEIGNRWFLSRPVQLDAEGNEIANQKGWKAGPERRKELLNPAWIPFDLPDHKVVMRDLQPGDLPG